MKTRNNLPASVFDEILYNFYKGSMESLASMQSHVQSLSCFKPVQFAYCINSCICYVGPYANLDECLKCGELHLNKSGQARQIFSYMPLIPCLCMLMLSCTYATHLQYHADEHAKTHIPGKTTDIFNRLHYCVLLGKHVVVGNQHLAYHYFSDHCDIALSFATDSFTPFKKQKQTM